MVLGMVARGLGRSLLKGREKKVSNDKLMGPRSKEGGGAVKEKGRKPLFYLSVYLTVTTLSGVSESSIIDLL